MLGFQMWRVVVIVAPNKICLNALKPGERRSAVEADGQREEEEGREVILIFKHAMQCNAVDLSLIKREGPSGKNGSVY